MPNLIKIDTQEYPVSLGEFRGRFKNISFPPQFNLEDFGYAVVFDVPQPAHTHYQSCREIAPEISVKGTWQQVWETVEMTSEEMKEVDMREAKAESDKAKAELLVVDQKSIRSLRAGDIEYIKKYEVEAIELRKKIIKD
jgi:hypothetical protein